MFLSKERLERWVAIATILSLLAVPVAVTYGGLVVQSRIAEGSTKREYLQLAVSILSNQDAPIESPDKRALRVWAVEILEANTPVALKPEARNAMMRGGLGPTPAAPSMVSAK